MKIGIDILGGDFAPEANIAGAVLARKELPQDVRLVLIGDQDQILSGLNAVSYTHLDVYKRQLQYTQILKRNCSQSIANSRIGSSPKKR